ncbi:hypothetical protein [Rossellomorea aquimaris]|uniref:Uncharacterized protein n=1 Tax=Rossellomorea aquimaris TaxID=189382 RepID=A0A366EMN6_9BACI|nr:hypothetical protein [Rossellomorea aquimaris]RBP03658.1 hypothetical protein DET59_10878 [Rossellomorea aquimaris]
MSEEKKLHPFDKMMYGGRTLNKEAAPSQEYHQGKNEGGSLLDGVQSIMNSIDDLKPLYKKISPLLKQWNIK